MSSYLETLSNEQVENMRNHFYSLGWGQNETMWKCWCQALDYIAPQLSAMTQRAEAAEAENAELTRKLAAQQAVFEKQRRLIWDCHAKESTNVGMYTLEKFQEYYKELGDFGTVLELTKLLAEAKSKAVPEGWQLVPKEPTRIMVEAYHKHYDSDDYTGAASTYKAMLAAAPQPETDIDQAQRFK